MNNLNLKEQKEKPKHVHGNRHQDFTPVQNNISHSGIDDGLHDAKYVLPVATDSALGGVRGERISEEEVANADPVYIDRLGRLWTKAVGDKTYVGYQELSDTWVVVHNLGKYPSVVTVQDLGGNSYEGDVIFDSENQLTIKFSIPVAGKVILN